MNDERSLVPLRARDEDGAGPCSQPGQGVLLADAIAWAKSGKTQEEIIDTLRQRYPGLPSEACYGNPAAEATMRVVRRAQHTREGQKADLARVIAKGLPTSLVKGGDPDALEPRPDYTDCEDDPDWRGPLHTEITACRNVKDLIALCAHYNLLLSVDARGLTTSHRIAADSDLLLALRTHKAAIVALLQIQDAPLSTGA